jgi:hypothetical protein
MARTTGSSLPRLGGRLEVFDDLDTMRGVDASSSYHPERMSFSAKDPSIQTRGLNVRKG